MTVECTVLDLWLKIDALMSDSASKNWDVAQLIAEKLHTNHVPHTLFCNTHYSLKLDEGNVKVLSSCEEK